ncbi:hypothetical protein B0H14DRAFT_3675304 [Mycena olivaceomarginata]|nr:hypothetical protein B0H14DRAFT_3675304 [Mycena olivaceomarginata]
MDSPPEPEPAPVPPVVDDEGYAICPDCKERVHCGPSGVQNLLKRHKDMAAPTLIHPPIHLPITSFPVPDISLPTHQPSVLSKSGSSPSAPVSLLARLKARIKTLPSMVKEATEVDALAVFGRDPASYLAPEVAAIEVYEQLNPLFHRALGWNMSVEETAKILKRGRLGLNGVMRFISYFVHERGVREQDFGAKIQQILDAIDFLAPNSDVIELPENDFLVTPPIPETEADEIEITAHIPAPIPSRVCEGFVFPLQDNQTVSAAYPLLLHDKGILPWDYAVRRGILYLTAYTCTGKQRPGYKSCGPCADLDKNNMLKGIIARNVNGVPENANLMYYSPAALTEIVRKKNVIIQNLRLGLLTSSRNLLTQSATMSDYKRFVVAIGSGKVQRVDRVVCASLKQKRGIRSMIDTFIRASKGLYNPAKTEEGDMVGVVMLKMAGVRVAEIAHRALGLPGVTTLRNRMITPPLTASPGVPQVAEIQKNIDACFTGITDALISKKVVHLIIMLDEIAVEGRIRWDPTTNFFLGVCRQHALNVGLEFNGEQDLDELMDAYTPTS